MDHGIKGFVEIYEKVFAQVPSESGPGETALCYCDCRFPDMEERDSTDVPQNYCVPLVHVCN